MNMLNEVQKTSGTTLLISSHDLKHITEVCNRIAILEKGRIIHDLTTHKETLKELESHFAV